MYILCDIGATKTRIAASSDLTNVLNPVIVPTDDSGVDHVIELIQKHFKPEFGEHFRGIVIGLPAILSADKSHIHYAPHLKGWSHDSIVDTVRHAFGCPVYLENDSALCALGEAVYGSGKGFRDVAYITVSTGVGGARIIDGAIHHGMFQSEPGHMIIEENGSSMTLDARISGSALKRRFGKEPQDITDEDVWEESARYLAYGLRNITVMWSPECIILGGGLILSGALDIERVREYFSQIMYADKKQPLYPHLPHIRKAHLGDEMGLYGGLAYVRTLVSSVHRL